jgi:tripartite ATP-independent transporter DctM subunit
MSPELLLTLGMFGGLFLCIVLGVSLAFGLGAIGLITAWVMWGTGGLMPVVTGVFNYMWMVLLAAVPLFVFIGVALSKTKIAEDLYNAFYLWSGSLRGGLAVGSCCLAAALSAMTGNNAASTVTTGLVGIPAMRQRGYKDSIILGTIGGAGTMGILIPPSIPLVVIGMMTGQSVGKLFAGGLTAGLFIVFIFIVYILLRAWIQPDLCPAIGIRVSFAEKMKALRSVALPLLIILSIIGSIFFGIATPTEAASLGCVAVILCVVIRGEFNWKFVKEVSYSTAVTTGMVLWIMFGAASFVAAYSGGGGLNFMQNLFMGFEVNRWVIFTIMQVIVFILGMFFDPMGIILICIPIFYPVVQALNFDPIWFNLLFNINLCMGYITPPFGYCLFYLKSLCPETPMAIIYRSVVPFILLMILSMVIMVFIPGIITWFPNVVIP